MRTLFLSFSGILMKLPEANHGVVYPITDEALENGLFAFTATRKAVFGRIANDPYAIEFRNEVTAAAVYLKMVIALTNAEVDRRVVWRTQEQDITYGQLGSMLEHHGILTHYIDKFSSKDPIVRSQIKRDRKLPLEVRF